MKQKWYEEYIGSYAIADNFCHTSAHNLEDPASIGIDGIVFHHIGMIIRKFAHMIDLIFI